MRSTWKPKQNAATSSGSNPKSELFARRVHLTSSFDGELPFIEGTRRYATNLTGKRLQLAYEGGFAETFEFTSGSTLLYGNGAEAGTYTYTVGQDTIDGDMTGRLKIQLDNSWGYDITFYPGSFSSVSLLDVGSTPVFDVAYHIFY